MLIFIWTDAWCLFPPYDANPMIQTPLSIAPLGPKPFEQSLNNANWQTVNPEPMHKSAQRLFEQTQSKIAHQRLVYSTSYCDHRGGDS